MAQGLRKLRRPIGLMPRVRRAWGSRRPREAWPLPVRATSNLEPARFDATNGCTWSLAVLSYEPGGIVTFGEQEGNGNRRSHRAPGHRADSTNCSRQRQSALISVIEGKCADGHRRLPFWSNLNPGGAASINPCQSRCRLIKLAAAWARECLSAARRVKKTGPRIVNKKSQTHI